MNANTGLVSPYQTVAQNPGGFAARRGRALRRGGRPGLRGTPWSPRGCPPAPVGCATVSGPPNCKVRCSPIPAPPPRRNNPGPLVWAGLGLGAAALAGGGYYLWQRQQEMALATATGVSVNADCTLLTVTDPEVSMSYFNAFVDTFVDTFEEHAGSVYGVDVARVAVAYLQEVGPQCGVTIPDVLLEGVDTWQKAAMVGGLALLVLGKLHDDGRVTDAWFKEGTEEIQDFLFEHGIDDLAMIEQVFETPESGEAQAGDGLGVADPSFNQ